MYRFCAFDLDGTLVYTIEDIAFALNWALEKHGFPALSEREVQAIVGYSTGYMCREALPEDAREAHWKAVHADCTAYYNAHCCDRSYPYHGVLRTLHRLKDAGVRMAVVSNKPHRETTKVVQTLFPRDTFSMVLGMMEKFEKKPAPEPLEFVLNYLGVEKEDAVYVGDSDVDVAFARNTGIDCISCTWGYRSRNCLIESGASRLIDDFEELLGLLL